jgi:hypothetical protein
MRPAYFVNLSFTAGGRREREMRTLLLALTLAAFGHGLTDLRKHSGEQAALYERQAAIAEAIAQYDESHGDKKDAKDQRFMENMFEKQLDNLVAMVAKSSKPKKLASSSGVTWEEIAKSEEYIHVASDAESFSHAADKIMKANQKSEKIGAYGNKMSPDLLTSAAGYQLMASTAAARAAYFKHRNDDANYKNQLKSQAKYVKKSNTAITDIVKDLSELGTKAAKNVRKAAEAKVASEAAHLSQLTYEIVSARKKDALAASQQVVGTKRKVSEQSTRFPSFSHKRLAPNRSED